MSNQVVNFKYVKQCNNLEDFPFKDKAADQFKLIQENFGKTGIDILSQFLSELSQEDRFVTETTINDFIQFEAYDFLIDALESSYE